MRFIASISFILLLSSCSTVFTGTSQNINIRAADIDSNEELQDVACTVTDGEGIPHIVDNNPGVVNVHKGKGTIRVGCKKPGYKHSNVPVNEVFNPVTIVNILFWPGLIVDAVTGAMQKYPSNVDVQMKKS